MNYNINEFKRNFLLYDFDNELIERNIDINNNTYYLERKREYISLTKKNCDILLELINDYNKIINNFTTNTSDKVETFKYTYIDYEYLDSINTKIKQIYTEQHKLFNNILSSIKMLSS
jgi:hypothetical protein